MHFSWSPAANRRGGLFLAFLATCRPSRGANATLIWRDKTSVYASKPGSPGTIAFTIPKKRSSEKDENMQTKYQSLQVSG
jgi:hypothetical protein